MDTITTSEIELFQILRQKIGDKEAEALVGFVDAKIKENKEMNLKMLATKADVLEAKADIRKWMFGSFFAMMLALIGLYFKK